MYLVLIPLLPDDDLLPIHKGRTLAEVQVHLVCLCDVQVQGDLVHLGDTELHQHWLDLPPTQMLAELVSPR